MGSIRFCLFCENQVEVDVVDHTGNTSGNPSTSTSLKTLFQYLHVGDEWSRSSVSVVEEGIASKICVDCAIVANGFGSMYESFNRALLDFLRQWIRKLASIRSNKTRLTPDATSISIPSPPLPPVGDGLRAEILKKWELKLNPNKSTTTTAEQELQIEQLDSSSEAGVREDDHQLEELEQVEQLEKVLPESRLDESQNAFAVGHGSVNHDTGNETGAAPHSCRNNLDEAGEQVGSLAVDIKVEDDVYQVKFEPPTTEMELQILENGECEDDDETANLDRPYHICDYCHLRLYGPLAVMERHLMLNHTVAYLTKRKQLPGFTTEEVVDRVMLELQQQGLVSGLDKQDTFWCSVCEQSISGQNGKCHFLMEHLELVTSRLVEISEKVANNSAEQPPPEPPSFPLSPSPGRLEVPQQQESLPTVTVRSPPVPGPPVAKIPPTRTGRMSRQGGEMAKLDRNRLKAFRTGKAKPTKPFTLVFLIKEAIAASPDNQLKRNDICKWIQSNFGYYRKSSVAKTLKSTLSSTLSKHFVKHEVDGREGVWRVSSGNECFKPRRKEKLPQPRRVVAETTSASSVAVPLNVTTVHSSSTRNDELPPPTAQEDSSRRRPTTRVNDPSDVTRTSNKTPLKCFHCRLPFTEPFQKVKLERHLMTVHTTRHFSTYLRPETSQQEVDRVVDKICEQRINSTDPPGFFHCSICGRSKAGDKKYHLLKNHFSFFLARLEGSEAGRRGVPRGDSSFDESLASSDLLAHVERVRTTTTTTPMEQEQW